MGPYLCRAFVQWNKYSKNKRVINGIILGCGGIMEESAWCAAESITRQAEAVCCYRLTVDRSLEEGAFSLRPRKKYMGRRDLLVQISWAGSKQGWIPVHLWEHCALLWPRDVTCPGGVQKVPCPTLSGLRLFGHSASLCPVCVTFLSPSGGLLSCKAPVGMAPLGLSQRGNSLCLLCPFTWPDLIGLWSNSEDSPSPVPGRKCFSTLKPLLISNGENAKLLSCRTGDRESTLLLLEIMFSWMQLYVSSSPPYTHIRSFELSSTSDAYLEMQVRILTLGNIILS